MSAQPSNLATEPAATRQAGHRRLHAWTALGLLIGFLGLYLANGEFSPTGDASPNVFLALSLLDEGDLLLTPDEAPQLFVFRVQLDEQEAGLVKFDDWNSGSPLLLTWRELADAGRLTVERPEYYLVPTVDPQQRGYVSAFGPGAAITAAPYFALQQLLVGDVRQRPEILWYGSKFVASLCVALSVMFVYLTVRVAGETRFALPIALCYGAGTCVWSVSSQTLWQSGPNVLWISIAVYCLFRSSTNTRWVLGCGAATAMAVLCRSTSALIVLAFAAQFAALSVWRWRTWRGSLAPLRADQLACDTGRLAAYWHIAQPTVFYLGAGLPLALLLFWHNMYCFGSPLYSAHLASGAPLAQETLGSSDVWQTSLPVGLAGLLLSVSRGMLIFSPILAAGLWGAVCCWFDNRWRLMRPLAAASLLILLVTAKHFNWHGGWSFGYRAIVDLVPLLAVCGLVVAVDIWRKPISRACFAAALAWSILVQVVGAYAYDLNGWNNRTGYMVLDRARQPQELLFNAPKASAIARSIGGSVQPVGMNVDFAVHRRRLWSLQDNQIGYYLTHWEHSRGRKEELIAARLRPGSPTHPIAIVETAPRRGDAAN
jgi:hypothetical protein